MNLDCDGTWQAAKLHAPSAAHGLLRANKAMPPFIFCFSTFPAWIPTSFFFEN